MEHEANINYKQMLQAIHDNDREKVEYYIHHLLENEDEQHILLYLRHLSSFNKDHSIIKKFLFKQIMKYKKDIAIRIYLIHILYRNKEYQKSKKWCERSLRFANNQQKFIIYTYLSKILYHLNRPERSLRYINLCLQLKHNYIPAIKLKHLIQKELNYESY